MILTQTSLPRDIEEQFVKTFVLSKFCTRACYELSSKVSKKRGNFFSKLSQIPPLILKKGCRIEIPHLTAELEFSTIKSMLIYYGAKEEIAYLMSNTIGLTQKILSLDEGLETCLNQSMAMVIICAEHLAFVQLERLSGSPTRFLLVTNSMQKNQIKLINNLYSYIFNS